MDTQVTGVPGNSAKSGTDGPSRSELPSDGPGGGGRGMDEPGGGPQIPPDQTLESTDSRYHFQGFTHPDFTSVLSYVYTLFTSFSSNSNF